MTIKKNTTKAVKPLGQTKVKKSAARQRDSQTPEAMLRTNDVVVKKGRAVNDLVADMPFNTTKEFEYGRDNAMAPRAGDISEPVAAALGASTLSEAYGTAKTGEGAAPGANAMISSLDRVRVDADGQMLTTNQGVSIADNQNSLKAGLRGPTLMMHFTLIPYLKFGAKIRGNGIFG